VGLVFAGTAAAKASDYYGFIEKAAYYRGFSYEALTAGAWATILIEVWLAALFLSGLAIRRVAAPLAMLVLVLFSGLIGFAWKRFGIDDCACLGSLAETPPWASLLKNAVLLCITLWLHTRPQMSPSSAKRRGIAALVLALFGTAAAAFAILHQTRGW